MSPRNIRKTCRRSGRLCGSSIYTSAGAEAAARRVQGRHQLRTSDALGAAAVQIGPVAVATAASLNKQFGLSFGKIATLLADRFGSAVTRGAVVRAVHRAAAQAQPTYDAVGQIVKTSAMVVADETGWRVHAELQWLWVT